MKKFLALGVCMFLFLVGVMSVNAGVSYSGTDKSVAFTVKNTGSVTATVAVVVSGLTNTVTIGSTVTTLTGASYDTITELVAGLNAATNSARATPLKVDSQMSLDADSVDAELLTQSSAIPPGATQKFYWDTSAAKFYSEYVPVGNLTGVTCVPTGTYASNTITLLIYEAGSIVYNAPMVTNAIGVVDMSWSPSGLGTKGKVLVRVVNSYDASTGNISVRFNPRVD